MKKRAIIIAAGEGTRWDDHLGVPKHFAPVDGTPIIERTVLLCRMFGIDDVWIAGPDDDRYRIDGSRLFVPQPMPEAHEASKFLDSRELWLRDEGRTFVLYGDVYFTRNTFKRMMAETRDAWFLWGRAFESTFTGNGDGELFAQTFFPGQIAQHERELWNAVRLYDEGVLGRIGGWEHYRLMQGFHLYESSEVNDMLLRHFVGDNFHYIDDFTEDFDYAVSYEKFMDAYERAKRDLHPRFWM